MSKPAHVIFAVICVTACEAKHRAFSTSMGSQRSDIPVDAGMQSPQRPGDAPDETTPRDYDCGEVDVSGTCEAGSQCPRPCDPCVAAADCSVTQCTSNADCARDPGASRCDGRCSPCLEDGDCVLVPGLPLCRTGAENRCVECLNDAHCFDEEQTAYCNVEAGSGAENTCVQCRSDLDCLDPAASRCEAGKCVPCQTDADCHLEGFSICDTAPRAPVCVECTDSRPEACAVGDAAFLCNGLSQECTIFTPRSADVCEPCISDSQCQETQLCVEQFFGDVSVGHFCFEATSACDARPFSRLFRLAVSIDGQQADVCGLAEATCPALEDFMVAAPCGTGAVPDSTECGAPGIDDGVCLSLGLDSFCSIRCDGVALNCTGGPCVDQVCQF